MLFGNKSSAVDWLVAGLGNPGQKYRNTRHNMGFLTVELLAEQQGVKLNRVKFKSAYNILNFAGSRCLVMKPQTYMNLSGEAVGEAARFYKLAPERVLVVCDDVALPPGKLRLRASGSAGGHNGLKSIAQHLGSEAYPRLRVGVGGKPHPDFDLADWVLARPQGEDAKAIEKAVARAAEAIPLILSQGVERAQEKVNRG